MQSHLQEGLKPKDSLEKVKQKEYNGTLWKSNFRNPFTNGINDTPIPVGLKGPRVKPYDGTGDPDDHVSNFQWEIKMIPMNLKL